MTEKTDIEIKEFVGSIFAAMGFEKIEDPAIPTFLPRAIPKKERWKRPKHD